MAKRLPSGASNVRSAAKLLQEVGGTPAPDLSSLAAHIVGVRCPVYRLSDDRILVPSPFGARTGHVYPSADALRAFLITIEARTAKPPGHPLGDAYPGGHGFIEAVPALIAQLPERLGIAPAALDGTVDGLERLDRAARRVGGQACLDDPVLLSGLVAYVGEVGRKATGGEWIIGRYSDAWEPQIGAAGGDFRPFVIFKELLERGSMYAAVSVHLGWSPGAAPRREGAFVARQPAIASAVGALARLPAETYRIVTRHGDGRPLKVTLAVDAEIDGVPVAAGSDAHLTRSGSLAAGVLSRPHTVLGIAFSTGTTIRLRTGRLSGVESATLGADQDIQGIPCQAGCFVQFRFHRRQPSLAAATLGANHAFGLVTYPIGTWFAIDRDGRLTDERPPGWGR